MIEAYKKYWKNYANFTDHSSRSDYWWSFLANVLIHLPFAVYLWSSVFSIIFNKLPYVSNDALLSEDELLRIVLTEYLTPFGIFVLVAWTLFSLVTFIPNLAITVRRLRDAGFHWAFIFIKFVPSVGPIILIVLLCQSTKVVEQFDDEDVI